MSAAAAKRELEEAGFDDVRLERAVGERRPARYQHLTAKRPRAELGGLRRRLDLAGCTELFAPVVVPLLEAAKPETVVETGAAAAG